MDIFVAAWEANQALASMGVYATGIAFILWGVQLLASGARMTGIVGLVSGVVPMILIGGDILSMDLDGALIIYSTHALLPMLLGAVVLRQAFAKP